MHFLFFQIFLSVFFVQGAQGAGSLGLWDKWDLDKRAKQGARVARNMQGLDKQLDSICTCLSGALDNKCTKCYQEKEMAAAQYCMQKLIPHAYESQQNVWARRVVKCCRFGVFLLALSSLVTTTTFTTLLLSSNSTNNTLFD